MNNLYKSQSNLEKMALKNYKLKLLLDSLETKGKDKIVCHWDYIGELYDKFEIINNFTIKKFEIITGLSKTLLPKHTNLCHCSQDNLCRNVLIYNTYTKSFLLIGSECIRRFMTRKKLLCKRCKIKQVNRLNISHLMLCRKCYDETLALKQLKKRKRLIGQKVKDISLELLRCSLSQTNIRK